MSGLFDGLFGEVASSQAKEEYQRTLAEEQAKKPESDARKEGDPKCWIN